MKKNCVVCGGEFEAMTSKNSCSAECRNICQRNNKLNYYKKYGNSRRDPEKRRQYAREWHEKNKVLPKRECIVCGETFTNIGRRKGGSKSCSKECQSYLMPACTSLARLGLTQRTAPIELYKLIILNIKLFRTIKKQKNGTNKSSGESRQRDSVQNIV